MADSLGAHASEQKQHRAPPVPFRIPPSLRPLFWDHDFDRLRWRDDRDVIIGRILAVGDWKAVRWLLRRLPKPELADWLEKRRGTGLGARQLRFWQIILELPRRRVDTWLANPARQVWEERQRA